jgi:hypothetical protein
MCTIFSSHCLAYYNDFYKIFTIITDGAAHQGAPLNLIQIETKGTTTWTGKELYQSFNQPLKVDEHSFLE